MTMSASVAVPSVAHGPSAQAGLSEKVTIRDLNFFYGEARALKSISLPLYQNKVTAFIGPSGYGKSTLLRVLNRMYDLYPHQRATGEVLFDGENILSPRLDLNLLRARIGMVFQKPTPFPMSIYENIAFGIRLYDKLPRAEIDARVEHALRRAALSDEGKDKLAASGLGLSGGQQQRLCSARTAAVKHEVSQFAKALAAVRDRDSATAEEVIADDARVDALDAAVQEQTVKLLALRQPMAVDLRVVLSSIKIAAALERIADYAKNTAKRGIVLAQGMPPASAVAGIDRLGRRFAPPRKTFPMPSPATESPRPHRCGSATGRSNQSKTAWSAGR